MNEVQKAIKRATRKNSLRSWWGRNDYKIYRVLLWPAWLIEVAITKYSAWLYKRQTWSITRAAEILNYYIPRTSEWDADNRAFEFFDNGLGWGMKLAKRHLKRRDRRFWKKYSDKIRQFLIDEFELVGFKKEVGECDYGQTWVVFYQTSGDIS